MEYISAEEFLKQPVEVQKVFLDWWQPTYSDLASYKGIGTHYEHYKKVEDFCLVEYYNKEDEISEYEDIYGMRLFNIFNHLNTKVSDYWIDFKSKFDVIPLFTEGQLRKFIEDKTGCKVDAQHWGEDGYNVDLYQGEDLRNSFTQLGHDLLQAYWKVAIEKAKEVV